MLSFRWNEEDTTVCAGLLESITPISAVLHVHDRTTDERSQDRRNYYASPQCHNKASVIRNADNPDFNDILNSNLTLTPESI